MAETKNPQPKINWDEEKKDFGKKAFAQALYFMEKDNEMISHFAIITGALANYLKENPDELIKLTRSTESAKGVTNDEITLEGSGFGSGLLDLIKEGLLGDKQFILEMIKELINKI